MEGDLDSSHIGFLRFGGAARGSITDATGRRNLVANRAPEYELAVTDFGVTYGVHRPAEDGGTYWRIAHFLFPFWVMATICAIEQNILARAWVPMDDHHTMFVSIAHRNAIPGNESQRTIDGTSLVENRQPNSTDWYGRFRLIETAANDYLIDREVQRTASYTGIEGIHTQDQAITESMSSIVDRTLERLAPSDIMVTRVRRELLNAARALERDGAAPPAAGASDRFREPRGGYFTARSGDDWMDTYREYLARARQATPPQSAAKGGADSAGVSLRR